MGRFHRILDPVSSRFARDLRCPPPASRARARAPAAARPSSPPPALRLPAASGGILARVSVPRTGLGCGAAATGAETSPPRLRWPGGPHPALCMRPSPCPVEGAWLSSRSRPSRAPHSLRGGFLARERPRLLRPPLPAAPLPQPGCTGILPGRPRFVPDPRTVRDQHRSGRNRLPPPSPPCLWVKLVLTHPCALHGINISCLCKPGQLWGVALPACAPDLAALLSADTWFSLVSSRRLLPAACPPLCPLPSG